MRGEHAAQRCPPLSRIGSSPHAWGAPHRLGRRQRDGGIIPACAGSTAPSCSPCPSCRDHPRMRGEHTYSAVAPWPPVGSSPHAWGALSGLRPVVVDVGITPACAGSTRSSPCGASPRGDHPRMRGEHEKHGNPSTCDGGSSPHARGVLITCALLPCCVGIIPACAGSTRNSWPTSTLARDHPRMRGEHVGLFRTRLILAGSSPHARGAPDRPRRHAALRGIIPACAGSTRRRRRCPPQCRDHPRMRGEHSTSECDPVSRPGSSPHARGARDLVAGRADRVRIIPACAGSTATCTSSTWPGRDHPRMRGEHVYVPSPPRPQVGSSPHARGAHFGPAGHA